MCIVHLLSVDTLLVHLLTLTRRLDCWLRDRDLDLGVDCCDRLISMHPTLCPLLGGAGRSKCDTSRHSWARDYNISFSERVSVINSQPVLRNDVTLYAVAR